MYKQRIEGIFDHPSGTREPQITVRLCVARIQDSNNMLFPQSKEEFGHETTSSRTLIAPSATWYLVLSTKFGRKAKLHPTFVHLV